MINVIIVLILVVIVGSALAYIIREKKKGNCIGCPYGNQGCHGCHGCNSKTNTNCGGHTNT